MTWERRKAVRKREIEALRKEGYEAALAGKSSQSCPHKHDMNWYQWMGGYMEGVRELDQRQQEQ